MNPKRLSAFVLAASVLSFGFVACGGGSDDDSGGGSFVTPGIDAELYATLLSDGTTALFFATDGESIHATLRGDAPAEGVTLSYTNEDGEGVEATQTETGYSGTLTLADGSTHDFTLEEVSRNNGGLYRNLETIRDEEWVIGLIVLNDGRIVGAARNQVTGDVEKRTTLSLGIKWNDPTADPRRQ